MDDTITTLVKGRNEEVAETAKNVMKKLKEEVEKKGLKLSVTENGKEGKSKMIASCGFLENQLRQFSREEAVTLAESVETLGVDLRTRMKRLGAKEKARRKKCMVRFSLMKKTAFQKSCIKVGVNKLQRAGMMPARTWVAQCSGDVSHGEVKNEEANGGCCGQEEYDLPLFVYGNTRPRS